MAQTDMVRTQKAPFRRLVCSSRSDSWEILLIDLKDGEKQVSAVKPGRVNVVVHLV